jgi:hypothetical protein
MNFDHAESAASHAHHDPNASHARTHSPHAPATWHPLNGVALGHLRGLAPGTDVTVSIVEVVDASEDLAIADRVAYVVTSRTGVDHVVVAGTGCYLVASVTPSLDWAAAMRLVPNPGMPRIVSVANADGILPILLSA